MYEDDIIGVCLEDDVEKDLAVTREICVSLLGSGAVADDKTEHGVRLDVIGYTIDLPHQRVLISRKNFLTALHGSISTDERRATNFWNCTRAATCRFRSGCR
jgi:hypothetical protein